MTVSKLDHALLSLGFLGNLSAPTRRNDRRPPPLKSGKTPKR